MPTLLLAFANNDTERLTTLKDEYTGVTDTLLERESQGDFIVVSRPSATRSQILADIRFRESDISLFLFSGHAGRDKLQLEDGIGQADGMAAILSRCSNLKVVILNGCSTAGQVNRLFKLNIPIVIATSSPVDDEKATRFSIYLFKELAQQRLPIREAFNRASEAAQVYGQISQVDVGLRGLDNEEEEDKPLWGLYYNQMGENLLDTWRLPVKESVPGSDELNKEIRKALLAIARKNSIPQEANATLERLPFVINEPIRNLFAIKADTQEASPFYDTASWKRFQMILYAYRSVINLTTYTLLAVCWDKKLRESLPLELPKSCLELVESTIFNTTTRDLSLSNLGLLKQLLQIFTGKKEAIFLSEIPLLFSALDKEILKKALDDLESKIAGQNELKENFSNQSDILRLCLEAEKSFSLVLFAFGFWVNYSLTSVKDIELLKFRFPKTPSYLHRIVHLQIGYKIPNRNDDQHSISDPLDSSSIILHRLGNWQSDGLNLSPFLIDKNALIRAPKADLHYLMSFSPKQNLFYYRKVTSYEVVWPVRPEKKMVSEEDAFFELDDEDEVKEFSNYYTLLKDQIASFAQSVLNKSLDEL